METVASLEHLEETSGQQDTGPDSQVSDPPGCTPAVSSLAPAAPPRFSGAMFILYFNPETQIKPHMFAQEAHVN